LKKISSTWRRSRRSIHGPSGKLDNKIHALLSAVAYHYKFAVSDDFVVNPSETCRLEFSQEGKDAAIVDFANESVVVRNFTLGKCKVKKAGTAEAPQDVISPQTKVGTTNLYVGIPGYVKMKTWLRPGKWSETITRLTVQDLGNQSFDGAAVDRAFYKSCNLMALQTLAGTNLL